jgi:hypothetical protein
MKLEFCPTIGERLYYLGDAEDENAPMLELRFQNEFATALTGDRKREIARKTLNFALTLMDQSSVDIATEL